MTCGAFIFVGLQTRFELNVVGEIVRSRANRATAPDPAPAAVSERFERFQRHDPRRDAGAEIFRQKRTERLVFPRLNIARAPVVHQDQAKNVVGRAIDRHRLA